MKPVIICGGIGSKMWPMSRNNMPKHFLPLINGKSLFQLNWETLRTKFDPDEIFLQTNQIQADIAKKQVPEIIEENIFIEPEMRNQGPATGFAVAQLIRRGFGDEPFILVQADVLREPREDFISMIEKFDALIRKDGKLITGGLKPDFAVMGVDYLKVNPETNVMEEFLGRGDKKLIESYLKKGQALIHTNHYAWTPNKMLECFKEKKKDWYEPLMNIINGDDVAEEYAKMPKGPIEEVTQTQLLDGYVIKLPFQWMDFGTWESVANFLTKEGFYNADDGALEIDSKNNFVYKKDKKIIAIIGVDDLVVVDTGDALLISKKDQTGKVGQIVDNLKINNKTELL